MTPVSSGDKPISMQLPLHVAIGPKLFVFNEKEEQFHSESGRALLQIVTFQAQVPLSPSIAFA